MRTEGYKKITVVTISVKYIRKKMWYIDLQQRQPWWRHLQAETCNLLGDCLQKRCRENATNTPPAGTTRQRPLMCYVAMLHVSSPRPVPTGRGPLFYQFIAGTRPGTSNKGASAAPGAQGVSCGQPPLPGKREFAPYRTHGKKPHNRGHLSFLGRGNQYKCSLLVYHSKRNNFMLEL